MRCIIETTQVAKGICHSKLQSHWGVINHLYRQILVCAYSRSQSNRVAQLHARIFQVGALVYFHRSILSSAPRTIGPLRDQLLGYMETYRKHGGGYVTIWPVFITAVEAYEERHQNGFDRWMCDCDKIDASNREDISVCPST